jgi:hypothetical protein
MAYPVGDPSAWREMRSKYKVDERHVYIAPDYATVVGVESGQYRITTYYANDAIGSYSTGVATKTEVSCEDHRLHLKYVKERARSDFGPNDVTTEDVLGLDSKGDLIVSTYMTVEYHMTLLDVPLGKGTFFSTYKFKRVTDTDRHIK